MKCVLMSNNDEFICILFSAIYCIYQLFHLLKIIMGFHIYHGNTMLFFEVMDMIIQYCGIYSCNLPSDTLLYHHSTLSSPNG